MRLIDSIPPTDSFENGRRPIAVSILNLLRKVWRRKCGLVICLAIHQLVNRNAWDGEKKTIAVGERVAPLINRVYLLAADKNHSLRKIVKDVAEAGLVSRNGKRMGVLALWNILRNPFYDGFIPYQG